jgi:hypothetical protein
MPPTCQESWIPRRGPWVRVQTTLYGRAWRMIFAQGWSRHARRSAQQWRGCCSLSSASGKGLAMKDFCRESISIGFRAQGKLAKASYPAARL